MREASVLNRLFVWFSFAVGILAAGQPALAQEPVTGTVGRPHGRQTLALLTVDKEMAPTLDGVMDDAAWEKAEPARDFTQREPSLGAAASERTEIKMLYDGTNLYFGITCFDSDPEGIVARELRRDDAFDSDDRISIVLDTFHDHRNSFLFRINPRGTQHDALITDEGRNVNTNWNEKWDVETQIGQQGWTAEIRLPLKSIRFAGSGQQAAFGVDFERVIRRKNETNNWNNFTRDFGFNEVSQAGHLRGVGEMRSALKLRVKPYVNGRVLSAGTTTRPTDWAGDIGLEDVKIPVTSGLMADLTVNTDFAQTEVDDQVINFDRVPLFFAEKREFFLEGAGIFDFGSLQGEAAPEIRLYHSRRIGLSESGKAVPMHFGAKIAGKVGSRWTLGIIEAQTGEFEQSNQPTIPGDNSLVVRLKRDLGSRSSVGTFFTNRQAEGNDYNRLVGADTNLIFLQHLKLTGVMAKSYSDHVEREKDWMGGFGVQWQTDLLDAAVNYNVVNENFRADLGFLRHQNVRRLEPRITFAPRPKIKNVRQLSFGFRLERYTAIDTDEVETQIIHMPQRLTFQNGSGFQFSPHWQNENLFSPLRLAGNLVVPPGKYDWFYYPITYTFNPAKKLSGSIQYRYEPDYYGKGGRRHRWELTPVFKISEQFSTQLDYQLSHIALAGQEDLQVFHQVNARVNYAFNRDWLTSTLIQYTTTGDLLGFNARLNYIYRPGDNLFIVFNNFTTDATESGRTVTQLDRSLVIKMTHSFDF